jgi:hypothetical protein
MTLDLDARLISTADAHLKILATNSAYDTSEAALRAASGSLRALLGEQMLQRAWKAAGMAGPITIPTWRFTTRPGPNVFGYCGGGDLLPGIPFSAGFNAYVERVTLSLHDFISQTRIIVEHVRVSTLELVQYFSNTMGGAHWDPGSTRKAVVEVLRNLEAQGGSPVPFLIGDRNMLHHEILSIAQALLASSELATLQRSAQGR